MNRTADRFVFFDDHDVEAATGEQPSRVQAGGARSDDDDVVHLGGVSLGVRPVSTIGAQNLRPWTSHVPRSVIQNESSTSRRSSQKDCRRTYNRSYRNFSRRGRSRGA